MNHIGYLLADNSRLARWTFDQRVRTAGVTGPQARLLLMLNRTPGANQGSYAEQLEVEPITLCRMVDRLEDAELVERRRDPSDRRAWQLHLTPKAQKIVERLQQEVDVMLATMLEGVSETERADFVRILKIVGSNLSACRDAAREMSKASNG